MRAALLTYAVHSTHCNALSLSKVDMDIIPENIGTVYAAPTEQIEHHCLICKSITVITIGVVSCRGCGRQLRLIQVDDDHFVDFGDN
jgi:hypothetical protein